MKNTLSNLKTRIVIILTVVVSACVGPHQDPGQTDLKSLYNAAIEDAAIAEKHEISKNLVAIAPSNNDLIWKNKEVTKELSSKSNQFHQLQSTAGKTSNTAVTYHHQGNVIGLGCLAGKGEYAPHDRLHRLSRGAIAKIV